MESYLDDNACPLHLTDQAVARRQVAMHKVPGSKVAWDSEYGVPESKGRVSMESFAVSTDNMGWVARST